MIALLQQADFNPSDVVTYKASRVDRRLVTYKASRVDLSDLPFPQPAAGRSWPLSEAMEAGFFPKPDEDVVDMFTPSELRFVPSCSDMHKVTGMHIEKEFPCSPNFD